MNENAIRVLDAYLDANSLSVPHAILIEGCWGSGKTYFLRNIYEPSRIRRMKAEVRHHVPFLFVSLFGANSASDVELRIYKTACPGEAVAGSIAGTIALGIGEFFRVKDATKGIVDKLGKKAIKRLNDFVFVFDDLERVEKQAFGEVMGLVNSLIADHGRRVILVTDERKLKELVSGEIWKEQNEKIVGRRASIDADFKSVICNSIEILPDGASKALIKNNLDNLLKISMASRVQNLRNLSWAMHNAIAFVDCLIADSEIPKRHTVWVMDFVVATTLWMRSGLLDTEALEEIPGLLRNLKIKSIGNQSKDSFLDSKTEKAKDFSETFPLLSVDAPPLDYKFVKGFEDSGVLDDAEVNLWIKSQFGFGKEHKEPSWRKLWYSHERPLLQTKQALSDLRDELSGRVYTELGPILHAAGLAIRQWAIGDHTLTENEDVTTFFKRYIDELADKNQLEEVKCDPLHFPPDHHGGLGFSSSNTVEFREIYRYICTKSQEIATAHLEERANAILTDAEAGNLEALFNLTHTTDYELSTKPALVNIPVDRLATLMARDNPALNAGAKLLAFRYYRTKDGDPLLQEIKWARGVYIAVLEKLNQWEEPYRTMASKHLKDMILYYEQDKEPHNKIIPPENKGESKK
ncbi:P-loop NTPase fold protein [Tistrella bauzanensis]|uniref:P-loop NTPase fold protein n=1 Tax=Tistrella TaxID=171436 RepID=UPI0031F6F145